MLYKVMFAFFLNFYQKEMKRFTQNMLFPS